MSDISIEYNDDTLEFFRDGKCVRVATRDENYLEDCSDEAGANIADVLVDIVAGDFRKQDVYYDVLEGGISDKEFIDLALEKDIVGVGASSDWDYRFSDDELHLIWIIKKAHEAGEKTFTVYGYDVMGGHKVNMWMWLRLNNLPYHDHTARRGIEVRVQYCETIR